MPQFMAELRLSQYYGNVDSLDSMLRGRLRCSKSHDHMQQRLLSERANLSLQKVRYYISLMDVAQNLIFITSYLF